MDINNLYIIAVENKEHMPMGILLFLVNAIVKARHNDTKTGKDEDLGDNLPFSIIERLQAGSSKGRRT